VRTTSGRTASLRVLQAMGDSLTEARGVHGSRTWASACAGSSSTHKLPPAARQRGGSVWIIFNGEIYNYRG
jgi:asparagine synthetase B (glutamine-hydrolysing)